MLFFALLTARFKKFFEGERCGLILSMFTYLFFHPDHIIPGMKFISALVKFSDQTISHMRMKFNTVVIQMWIFFWSTGDAGIHVENSLSLQGVLQSVVQKASDSLAVRIVISVWDDIKDTSMIKLEIFIMIIALQTENNRKKCVVLTVANEIGKW